MVVSFDEIGQVCATFAKYGELQVGQVCRIAGSGKVMACDPGNKFIGLVTASSGDYVTVVLSGFVTLKYTGSAPALGYNMLAAGTTGSIRVDANNGRQLLVAGLDTSAQLATVYL